MTPDTDICVVGSGTKNGDYSINIRNTDGYVQASDMCKAGVIHWSKQSVDVSNNTGFKTVSKELTSEIHNIIQSTRGGFHHDRSVWVHPQIAISLAKCINPEFAVDVSIWINHWKENSSCSHTKIRICDRLASELLGDVEVDTVYGKVDIITDDQIIEVNDSSNWEYAMGRVLAYSIGYPNHIKRIHLFGVEEIDIAIVRKACSIYNIIVTLEI
jgi:hypothetical protein